jgi:hypothetical protein
VVVVETLAVVATAECYAVDVEPATSLEVLARRYVWWQPPAQTLLPERRTHLLCQLMQLATPDDVRVARALLGDEAFRVALREAPPGVLDARSWNFWHLFWFHTAPPPMPVRVVP